MSDRKLPMDKSERILNELLKIPVNTICCDCGAANPKWASFSLGCFLCVRCCSVHRKMGTHITKVKSVSLDSWTQEDIDTMKNWGNGKVNAMYMPHPEKHPPPTSMEGSAMEQYIRSKYEKKQFMEGGGGNSHQASSRSAYGNTFSGGNGNSRSNNDIMTTQAYTTQMKALRSMGFTDNAKNLQVLQSTDGDVPNAIEILCRIGQGPVTASTPSRSTTNNSRTPARSSSNSNNTNTSTDPKEKILWNMGFHDSALNKEALRRAGGNPDVAAGILIDDKDKLAKAVRDKASGSPALPNRLDPPSGNRNNNSNKNNQSDDLLLDLSTPDDNQQQLQQHQQQLLFQQQQMQMQNAFGNNNNNYQQFGNNDQFGQNHNQLQSILDKNASILALYSNESQGMNNAFGLQQPQQQQQMGGNNIGDMNSWGMNNGNNNNNNNNNNMAMSSAFGLQQSSMATGNNNMFGNNNNNGMMGMSSGMSTMGGMGNNAQTNPFGGLSAVSQQSSGNFSTPSSMGFNSAFGVNNNSGNNNQFSGLGTMGAGSPMTTNQNLFGTNNNNMFASGANAMGGAGMGSMGNNNAGMNGMNGFGASNNNNFNSAFGVNPNQGNNMNNGNQHNPWGNNNNNNNNNQGSFF